MKMNWWSSLRLKIITWSFIPTVIILSAVAWFTFFSYQKVLGDLAIKQDWAIIQTKLAQANQALSGILNTHLRQVVLNIDTHPDLPIEARIQNILDQAEGLDDFDGGIYFVDSYGKVFKTHPERPALLGLDLSDTPQFRYIRNNPPGSSPVTDVQDFGPGVGRVVCAILAMQNTQKELIGAGYYCFKIRLYRPEWSLPAFNQPVVGRKRIFHRRQSAHCIFPRSRENRKGHIERTRYSAAPSESEYQHPFPPGYRGQSHQLHVV